MRICTGFFMHGKCPLPGSFLLIVLGMIHFETPYSFNKNFFDAIDKCFEKTSNEDWLCIRDGDTMFLQPDYGHIIKEYIDKYPDTGLFTCITNRCHYACQRLNREVMEVTNIVSHHIIANEVYCKNRLKISQVKRRIAGHLMIIKKSTWMKIRKEVQRKVIRQNKKILGVDTKISNAMIKHNFPIRIMLGLYIFHYMRFHKSISDYTHLV